MYIISRKDHYLSEWRISTNLYKSAVWASFIIDANPAMPQQKQIKLEEEKKKNKKKTKWICS